MILRLSKDLGVLTGHLPPDPPLRSTTSKGNPALVSFQYQLPHPRKRPKLLSKVRLLCSNSPLWILQSPSLGGVGGEQGAVTWFTHPLPHPTWGTGLMPLSHCTLIICFLLDINSYLGSYLYKNQKKIAHPLLQWGWGSLWYTKAASRAILTAWFSHNTGAV